MSGFIAAALIPISVPLGVVFTGLVGSLIGMTPGDPNSCFLFVAVAGSTIAAAFAAAIALDPAS